MVVARRPPKMIALIGTPSGFCQSGSSVGHWLAGAVKRLFGCAAGLLPSYRSPRQVVMPSGGAALMPSHQTSPSAVSATLVKIVFSRIDAIAFGLVATEVPGATPKYPASGLTA